jgi:hypothetical protein
MMRIFGRLHWAALLGILASANIALPPTRPCQHCPSHAVCQQIPPTVGKRSLITALVIEVHFGISVFRNVFFISKSEKNPLVRQNCAVTLQDKKIEI